MSGFFFTVYSLVIMGAKTGKKRITGNANICYGVRMLISVTTTAPRVKKSKLASHNVREFVPCYPSRHSGKERKREGEGEGRGEVEEPTSPQLPPRVSLNQLFFPHSH